ncbi:MAG: insulinase family protein [Candidatus Pacebacteria bacterium]|nr:insulinase family protein [Candidatus Paceibacterota bacterium]
MKHKKTVLENGLRIVTIPMKDNPTVTVMVLVEAGSKYETKEINGISHFLEHLCFKGTEKRLMPSDISTELDGLGAQTNAFTGHEFTGYYAKVATKHLSKTLDIISDLYLNPTLPAEEIEREKGVILDEINMYEDLPPRHVEDLFMKVLHGDHPAGWEIIGSKENVKKMTREDIVSYRSKHYVAEGTVVVVAGGGFDQKKLIKDIEKKFETVSSLKKGKKKKVIEKQDKPNIVIENKKTDQTHLFLGVRTFRMNSKNKAALKVLAGILGGGMSSRLFRKLREEMGVGYYIHASSEFFTDHGHLAANTGVCNERAGEVVGAILGEFKKMTEDIVDEKELKKVKDYLTGNIMLGLESSDSIAEYHGVQEVLKKDITEPKKLVADLQDVTASDVRAVARKIFKNDRLNLALIGPFKNDEQFKKILIFK